MNDDLSTVCNDKEFIEAVTRRISSFSHLGVVPRLLAMIAARDEKLEVATEALEEATAGLSTSFAALNDCLNTGCVPHGGEVSSSRSYLNSAQLALSLLLGPALADLIEAAKQAIPENKKGWRGFDGATDLMEALAAVDAALKGEDK